MKLSFDNFDSMTGWTKTGTALIYGLNDHPELIAGNLLHSLILYFATDGDTCKKTFSSPIDVSAYKEIVFSVYSTNNGNYTYNNISDFVYKISFGSGKDYYLPVYSSMFEVVLDISSLTTIEYIEIEALTTGADYLVLSYGLLVKDQFPLDVFTGLQEQIQYEISQDADAQSILVGTINAGTGDSSITFGGTHTPDYLERYSKIKITDGVNTEYHHIKQREKGVYFFNSFYDGMNILHDYTNASVYLELPVISGMRQREIHLPGIALWTLESEKIFQNTGLDSVSDTWNYSTGLSGERQEGQYLNFPVLIDCESRHDEILALMSGIVRRTLGKRKLYVNGRMITFDFTERSREIEQTNIVEIVPKVQYIAYIQIKEDIYNRDYLYLTKTINTDLTITQ